MLLRLRALQRALLVTASSPSRWAPGRHRISGWRSHSTRFRVCASSKLRMVYLGTPQAGILHCQIPQWTHPELLRQQVAAEVLQALLRAAQQPEALHEVKQEADVRRHSAWPMARCTEQAKLQVVAVVSQPGRPRGRGKQRKPQPSPVEAAALVAGCERILCPASARDVNLQLHALLKPTERL